jgi:hypothetical protein
MDKRDSAMYVSGVCFIVLMVCFVAIVAFNIARLPCGY